MEKQYFGAMLDMSRNGVMKVERVKLYVDYLKKFGYNSLMLYTEDTYEVDQEPYFGYLRGRYSKEEIREIDSYCKEKDIELIPCIQTLAHLRTIFRWKKYIPIRDYVDILLVDDEKTYELIENIFATLAETFTSRVVHIGMDEARMLGMGDYFDKHGFQKRTKIFKKHLERVIEIAQRHGFRVLAWSDMFFHLCDMKYYAETTQTACVTSEMKQVVPEGVELVFWDYYHTEQAIYDSALEKHQQLCDSVWFAGGVWTWHGFAPLNGYALDAMIPAMKACKEHGINHIFLTLWGDDGGECPLFSVLPALFYIKKVYDGETDEQLIKQQFYETTGEDFDTMMLLDLPNQICGNNHNVNNPCKYLLYNDLFNGYFDANLPEGGSADYEKYAEVLKEASNTTTSFAYIFESMSSLCSVLAVKYDLGIRIRTAYQKKDMEQLRRCIFDISELEHRIETFYRAFKRCWNQDNKPHGFDVQDIRLGGLMNRCRSCREYLQDYIEGRLDQIPELEEQILDFFNEEETEKKFTTFNYWCENVTVNNI